MQDNDSHLFRDKKKAQRCKNHSKIVNNPGEKFKGDSRSSTKNDEVYNREEVAEGTSVSPSKSYSCSGDYSATLIKLNEDIYKQHDSFDRLQKEALFKGSPSHSLMVPEVDPFLGYKPQLESVIAEQNILIEKLRENLNKERERSEQSEKELCEFQEKSTKQIERLEYELSDMKKFFLEKQEKSQSIDPTKMKNEIEEELHSHYRKTLKEYEEKSKAQLFAIDMKHKEKLNLIVDKHTFKEYLYEKQIELMKKQIEKMYHCNLLKGEELFVDENCDKEIERLRASLQKLGSSGSQMVLPNYVTDFGDQLAASIANEISLKAELQSCKSQSRDLLLQVESLEQKLKQFSLNESLYESKFTDLEHDLNVCNHDRDEMLHTVNSISAQNKHLKVKCERLVSEIHNQRENISEFSSDIVVMADVLKNFSGELVKMVSYYGEKLSPKHIEYAKSSQIDNEFEVNLDLPVSALKPEVNEILSYMVDSRSSLYKMNDILGMYCFFNTIYCKNQEELDHRLKMFKNEFKIKENKYEGKISQLHEKLTCQIGEIKKLESEILKYQNEYITKIAYDEILCEKNFLLAQLKEIESTLNRFDGSKIDENFEKKDFNERLKALVSFVDNCGSKNSPCKTSEFFPLDNKILLSSATKSDDSSRISESPSFHANLDFATSTPFKPKKLTPEPVKIEEITSLKTALIEWVEKCKKFSIENKSLQNNIYELKFQLNQTKFSKQVLEEEISVMNSKMELLQNKVQDYVSLKEKCNLLENDNDALEFKIKYILNNQNAVPEESKSTNNCSYIFKEENNKIAPSTKMESSNVQYKFDLLQDLSSKSYEILYLQEKCKSLGKENSKLKLKLISSDEIITSFKKKMEMFIVELGSDQEQIQNLSDENIQLSSQNKLLAVEINALKSRISYLASLRKEEFGQGDLSTMSIVEKLQEDSLNCYKEAIDKMCEIQKLKLLYSGHSNTGRLDARHREEILLKNNSHLQHEKEELFQKCCQLQEMLHSKKVMEGVDEGWFIQLEKLESGLLAEFKDHRQQHARIEEALRSTGNLHNELQELKDLRMKQYKEIANAQKKLEEEKSKNNNIAMKSTFLEESLKEKEAILQTILDEKKSLEMQLVKLEEDFSKKELLYKKELLQIQWKCKNYHIKEMEAKVMKESEELKLIGGTTDDEFSQFDDFHKRIELNYQQSVQSLAHQWESDKAQLLANQQAIHISKV